MSLNPSCLSTKNNQKYTCAPSQACAIPACCAPRSGRRRLAQTTFCRPTCPHTSRSVPSSAAPQPPPVTQPQHKTIIIIIIIRRFSCQEARCVLQTSGTIWLPQSYPLLDSPDPSKTQSTAGTVLSVYTGPRQPGTRYSTHQISREPCKRASPPIFICPL